MMRDGDVLPIVLLVGVVAVMAVLGWAITAQTDAWGATLRMLGL